MENQHREIKGYRELDRSEIDLMNRIKEMAAQVGQLVGELETVNRTQSGLISDSNADPRWVAIGKTDLQKGFMALTRSIAKPDFF